MRTQTMKNAIIVPTGAKGGVRAAARRAAPVDAYREFIRGLLDVADDVVDGDGRPSARASACSTSDDPYLVVAADKGTATFSDVANAIARRARLLARRRVRVRRLARLRPQGARHHGARRVGVRARALPRARRRRRHGAASRRRHRRHGAATCSGTGSCCSPHAAARGGVQPPARLPRPGSRSGARASPSGSGCSAAGRGLGRVRSGRAARRGGVVVRAPRSACRSRPRRGALLGVAEDGAERRGGRAGGARASTSTCSGTAASGPTCARPTSRTRPSAIRRTTPSA